MTASTAPRTQRRRATGAASLWGPWGLFLKGFFKHPVMVGSIMPSSSRLIEKMLAPIDSAPIDWAATRLFVEYGPGVGTFCRPVLDRLGPDARYIAIDTNPDFIRYLRHEIVDSRFAAVQGSASDVREIIAAHGHDSADYILSGLPFSTLPPGVGDAIGRATADALSPGGAFLVYQFSPKCRDSFAPYLPRIDQAMEWWNVPPAQLYWAWKDVPASDPATDRAARAQN